MSSACRLRNDVHISFMALALMLFCSITVARSTIVMSVTLGLFLYVRSFVMVSLTDGATAVTSLMSSTLILRYVSYRRRV